VANPIDTGRKPSSSTARIAGRYELQDQLGEGGMGVVWRALDTKTGSCVAIKIMKDISDPVAVELFAKEWKALAEISHPNIVDVRDVDVIEENRQKKPFFVMPLLQGATLAELIADASARLTLGRIVEIFGQVCKGLQAAHRAGLVHRDLKPSNIFVMADDTAKIIDFGVVHLAGSKSVTGQKGTFQYMSPEQAQLKEITSSSDIFALGVILYEALTLRKPFARNTVEETMQAVIKFIPPPVSEINPNVNQSISKVVHKCLAKQPIHRFLNARELAETLQKAYRNEPIFDPAKIQPRIDRAKAAFKTGDEGFASEILAEIEAEGNLDPQITVLRTQIEMAVKQKKIRQLLESARSRMEQDEIPLALDKVREVLELDSENADALGMRAAMEKQRSESQIAKWLDLASTHLGNCDFGAARHAVEEVLAIRRADTRALDLMEKIESTEADAKRVRDQKEQLYSSALRAYQNGEIETALSKLERLLSVTLNNPQAGIPERDAVYQSFYKEVRSERDSIQSAMEEAQRQFGEKKFAGALTICRDLLVKYPNDGALQALKIQIEDTERQEMSAYIATVSKSVESEPDLDRRANILREASERYPAETQFGQQLKMVRERRDLVNSIVAKARQYEERGQYSEAISQWDILRNIHPQYPGMAFELEQCKKKRSRQAREEEKTRAVEEIDSMMESRAFARAIEAAKAALREFPGDVELAGLQKLAEEGLERTKESRRLFEEGQQALAEKDLERATELLRGGLKLDPRGPGLREAVVSVLTERARGLVEENWHAAEPLYEEAKDLDGNHPAVRALRSSISEAKRQSFVGQCLTEARALLASGNSQAAFERVRAARAEYPNDPRLEQYAASLSKEVNEVYRREERQRDRAALGEERSALDQNPDRARMRAAIERSQVIRAKYTDDAEIEQTVADIEQAAKRVARVENLSEILRVESARTATEGGPAPVRRSSSKQGPARNSGAELVDAKTKVFPQPQPKENAGAFAKNVSALFETARRKVSEAVRQSGKWHGRALAGLGIIVAVGAIIYVGLDRPKGATTPKTPETHLTQLHIVPDPLDSTVSVDSNTISDGIVSFDARGGVTVNVSRLGYKTKQVPLKADSDGRITLDPEPVLLSVETSDKGGAIEIDGQKIDLPDGSLEAHELIPDGKSHQLSVVPKGGRPFTINFQSSPGQRPKISSLDTNDVFVITSLGPEATVYGGNQVRNVVLGDQRIAVTATGTDLPALTDQNRTLKYGEGGESGGYEIETGNSPTLVVHSLGSEGQVTVTANVDNAKLTVDGREVKRGRNGGWQVHKPPGKPYNFVLSAEGYVSQQWTMDFQRGKTLKEPRMLVSEKKEVVKSPLILANNLAGATVEIDNVKVGELDPAGKGQFLNALLPGLHTITLRNSCGEKKNQDFMVSPPAPVQVPNLNLTACGTVSFQNVPKEARVQIKRHGDSKWMDVDPLVKSQARPGEYDVKADGPGLETYTTAVKIEPNREWQVPLIFTVQPTCQLQDATQVVSEPGWLKLKNPGDFIYLKAGCSNVNLIFTKPHTGILGKFGKKRPQWTIKLSDGNSLLEYELDDQKLTRSMVVGEVISDRHENKGNAEASGQNTSLSVKVRIEGNHVKVTNDKGEVLDDYMAKENLTNAKLGIKTDAHFIFRSIP
jgi:serine/threonine protein kinase